VKVMMISANVTLSPYPIYPLGMSMVAAALTKAGHTVHQVDFLHQDTSLEAIGREVEAFRPDLVGISVRNIDNVNLMNSRYYIDNVKNMVDAIKSVTDARIVLGGAGFSLIPDQILEETGADFGVIGEGETLMVELAGNAAQGVYPQERLLGPAVHMSGEMIGPALYDEQLTEFYLQSGNIASIQTKRGCGHHCIYCSYPLLEGSHLRKRDPAEVVDDIELLRDKHKTRFIFFVDSVFNDDQGAYLEVVDEMLARDVSIPWTGFIKPGGLTDEIVERMKKTGFAAAEVGSDAACDAMLHRMGKSFSFGDIVECNDLMARHGIATSHFFMFGGPGETEETVREGIANILSLTKCVVFIFMGIRLLPNTPLAKIAIREGVIKSERDMLQPVYYISPGLDKTWLKQTLTTAFAGVRHCLFPPDSMDSSLQVLHKLGYTGPMWDLLLQGDRPRKRAKHVAK
jgi:lipid biosynthesis B12-binding/radical SAM protein